MNAFALMLGVTACYTISSLSDKYAAAKAKFTPDGFTFLMCASMSVFLALTLPFQTIAFTLSWQAFAGVGLVALCKLLEFRMSVQVLREMSYIFSFKFSNHIAFLNRSSKNVQLQKEPPMV